MASLGSIISTIFEGSSQNSHIRRGSIDTPITPEKYMEIPINSNVFELPLLAFEDFKKINQNRKACDVIVASLYSCGQTSGYKSFDSIMKDVLSTRFNRHLCKVQVANTPNVYYATFGAVFDENLTPLMMLSWIMEKIVHEGSAIKYQYKKPLLRLNPYPCINKEDALQKFLCGRWVSTTLGTTIYTPSSYGLDYMEDSEHLNFNYVKVEIDECPFIIRGTDVPSISVTNEGLLQLAADHIDEILQ